MQSQDSLHDPLDEAGDPLDEIGDLVGKTLDIFGNATNAAVGASTGVHEDKEAAGSGEAAAGGRLQSIQLDDVDLLSGGGHQEGHAASSDPLSFGGGLPPKQSYNSEQDGAAYMQPSARYEDLGSGRSSTEGAGGMPQAAGASGPLAAGDAGPAASEGEASDLIPAGPAPSQPAPSKPAPEHLIKVTIREPEKVEAVSSLGIKTHYVTYTVRTDSTMPGLLAQGLEVKRRFSDFDALHKHLRQEYRGYVVPPLPEKSFLAGKMAQDDFIRLRRADLQAFIKSLTTHPVLRDSEALKIFLLQPGELNRNPAWTYLVNPPPALRQQRAGSTITANSVYNSVADTDGSGATASHVASSLKAGLGSWVSWMKSSMAQLAPVKEVLAEDEVQLRQSKELLQDLEQLLSLAVEAARSLCSHQEAVCGDVKEIGRTFAMLSRYEEAVQSKVGQYTAQGCSAANRAADLQRLALGAAKQHGVWKTLSIKTAASLVTLHDYWVLVPEAIHALEAREAALNHLHQLQHELAAKTQVHAQAASGPNKDKLGASLAALEGQIREAQQDYDTIKARNQEELSRLNLEREEDFRRMMALFARTQAELTHASAEIWTNLARQFE